MSKAKLDDALDTILHYVAKDRSALEVHDLNHAFDDLKQLLAPPFRKWLSGYALTLEDAEGNSIATIYAPTMAEGERIMAEDLSLGAYGIPPAVTKVICEWHDELILQEDPAAKLWRKS